MSNLKSVSSIPNLLTCKDSSKNKKFFKLGPEIPYLGIFGLHFNKNYCQIFNTLKFVKLLKNQKFVLNLEPKIPFLGVLGSKLYDNGLVQKIKILKFVTKSVRFPYSGAGISKYYCHIWNQRPQICLIAKFREKRKTPKFGIKNALLGYFCAGISKNYCHTSNQLPRTCLIAKFCRKTKMPKLSTKSVLFGYFWAKILKTIVIFAISTFELV